MARKKHERRIAREAALSLLYSSDITESDVERVIEEGAYPADIELSEYAEELALGTVEHLDDIDARLASTSENWALDRMPVVDRAVLRLATYEMLYVDDVPVSVAINEAVELAKAYGGEDESSRFVNGVLGRIARAIEGEGSEGSEKPESPEGPESSEDIESPESPESSKASEKPASPEDAAGDEANNPDEQEGDVLDEQ